MKRHMKYIVLIVICLNPHMKSEYVLNLIGVCLNICNIKLSHIVELLSNLLVLQREVGFLGVCFVFPQY